MASSEHSQPHYSGSVVVVDDNGSLRELLALALETAGFEVVAAGTQLELQRYLVDHRPDALVIDLQRSEADGLALLTRMRARRALDDVPILFMAGSDADDFRLQAMTAGADWFGLRPVGLIELTRLIGELVAQGRAPRRQRPRAVVSLKRVG
jgi:two-component system, OmpR family, phosphate regulon response regulator PhoB